MFSDYLLFSCWSSIMSSVWDHFDLVVKSTLQRPGPRLGVFLGCQNEFKDIFSREVLPLSEEFWSRNRNRKRGCGRIKTLIVNWTMKQFKFWLYYNKVKQKSSFQPKVYLHPSSHMIFFFFFNFYFIHKMRTHAHRNACRVKSTFPFFHSWSCL